MGLTVLVETEAGEPIDRVEDPTNVLHRFLPNPKDARFRYLGTIDWYGDTVFNDLQIPQFLEEWAQITDMAPVPAESALVRTIKQVAQRAGNERHLSLKIYGD